METELLRAKFILSELTARLEEAGEVSVFEIKAKTVGISKMIIHGERVQEQFREALKNDLFATNEVYLAGLHNIAGRMDEEEGVLAVARAENPGKSCRAKPTLGNGNCFLNALFSAPGSCSQERMGTRVTGLTQGDVRTIAST